MNTQDKIKVMQAWVDGKTIQVRHLRDNNDCFWEDVKCEPVWCWDSHTYRIKPQTVAYRRYLWSTQNGIAVSALNKSKYSVLPSQVETSKTFIHWLDHDWVYIEI